MQHTYNNRNTVVRRLVSYTCSSFLTGVFVNILVCCPWRPRMVFLKPAVGKGLSFSRLDIWWASGSKSLGLIALPTDKWVGVSVHCFWFSAANRWLGCCRLNTVDWPDATVTLLDGRVIGLTAFNGWQVSTTSSGRSVTEDAKNSSSIICVLIQRLSSSHSKACGDVWWHECLSISTIDNSHCITYGHWSWIRNDPIIACSIIVSFQWTINWSIKWLELVAAMRWEA